MVGQIGHPEQKVGHLASLLYGGCSADWLLRTRTVPPKVEQLVTLFVCMLPYKRILQSSRFKRHFLAYLRKCFLKSGTDMPEQTKTSAFPLEHCPEIAIGGAMSWPNKPAWCSASFLAYRVVPQ